MCKVYIANQGEAEGRSQRYEKQRWLSTSWRTPRFNRPKNSTAENPRKKTTMFLHAAVVLLLFRMSTLLTYWFLERTNTERWRKVLTSPCLLRTRTDVITSKLFLLLLLYSSSDRFSPSGTVVALKGLLLRKEVSATVLRGQNVAPSQPVAAWTPFKYMPKLPLKILDTQNVMMSPPSSSSAPECWQNLGPTSGGLPILQASSSSENHNTKNTKTDGLFFSHYTNTHDASAASNSIFLLLYCSMIQISRKRRTVVPCRWVSPPHLAPKINK